MLPVLNCIFTGEDTTQATSCVIKRLLMAQELPQGEVYPKCLLPSKETFVNSVNHQESWTEEWHSESSTFL